MCVGFCVKPTLPHQHLESLYWNQNKLYFLDVVKLPGCLTKENISTIPESTSLQYGWVFPVLSMTRCLSISESLFNSDISASIRKFKYFLQNTSFPVLIPGYFMSVFTHQTLWVYLPRHCTNRFPGNQSHQVWERMGGRRVKSSFKILIHGHLNSTIMFWGLASNSRANSPQGVREKESEKRRETKREGVYSVHHWWVKVEEGGRGMHGWRSERDEN